MKKPILFSTTFQGIVTADAVPFIVFGGMLLLSGALTLLLQETLNEKLPETIEEVRTIDSNDCLKEQQEKTDHAPATDVGGNIELTSCKLLKS